jgi:thiol-disulfide isomerase/thioredoxin
MKKNVVELASVPPCHLPDACSQCPPCRGFTPKLAEAYQKIKGAGHAFEIVFVSSDKSEQQFAEYFATMPWLAMPLAMRDLKAGLSQMFGVRGIPALILLDGATGELISKDGRCGHPSSSVRHLAASSPRQTGVRP